MNNTQRENQEINPIPRTNPTETTPKTNPVRPTLPEILPEINRAEPRPILPEIKPVLESETAGR